MFHVGTPYTDSSIFRYIAYAMSKGEELYRDTFDHKGPLLYLINYIGLLIHSKFGVWMMELFTLVITTFFVFLISEKVCKKKLVSIISSIIVMASLGIYFQEGIEEYAMPLIAISIYIFMEYFLESKTTRVRLFVCGICGGGVLMLRPNMAVTWLVFPIFVFINDLYKKQEDNIRQVIIDWYPIVEKIGDVSKLVIIDDGSKDNTYGIMSNIAKNYPMFEPLRKSNGGHGSTVLYGYRYAIEHGADYIFQTDSDGQTNSAEFEDFWN